MKKLKLKNSNIFTIVDDEDYVQLIKHQWCLRKDGYVHKYVIKWNGTDKQWLIHRFILNIHQTNQNIKVDHIDGNTLNNQKCNLRLCTTQNNCCNQKKQDNQTSKFKGVSWHKKSNKWRATISDKYKAIHLGLFNSEIEAGEIYDYYAIKFYKQFARLNFPNKDYSNYIDKIKRKKSLI